METFLKHNLESILCMDVIRIIGDYALFKGVLISQEKDWCGVTCLLVQPDEVTSGSKIIAGLHDGKITTWHLDLLHLSHISTKQCHNSSVTSLANVGNTQYISGSSDSTIRSINRKISFPSPIMALAVSPTIIAIGDTTGVRIYNYILDTIKSMFFKSDNCVDVLHHHGAIADLRFIGTSLITTSYNIIHVWDIHHYSYYFHVSKDYVCDAEIISLAVTDSEINSEIIVGLINGDIVLFRGDEKFVLVGHMQRVSALLMHPDGRIISGSYDTTIRIWEWDCRLQTYTSTIIYTHTHKIMSLAALPAGNVVAGSSDGSIYIFA